MSTFVTRMYWERDHIVKWLKLEARGRLGTVQAAHLAAWRRLKAKHPDMEAMFVQGGNYGVWQRYEKGKS